MDVLNPLEFSRNDGSKFSGLIYHKVSCPVFSRYFVSVSTEVSVEARRWVPGTSVFWATFPTKREEKSLLLIAVVAKEQTMVLQIWQMIWKKIYIYEFLVKR